MLKKTVLIAGGSGLVGSRLSEMLTERGYKVTHLSRKSSANGRYPTFSWDVAAGKIDENAFDNVACVINLAGTGIADKRWTTARKKDIIESRTKSTDLLKKYVRERQSSIEVYLSASAIGIYGDRPDEILTEEAPMGNGFLAESTHAWEKSIIGLMNETSLRTVALRIGVVLSTQGGALPKILLSFLFRIGVYFGNGQQWFSWIHIDDLCRMFIWAIENPTAKGFYNATAPTPLSNLDFTDAVGRAKGGFFLKFPAPSFMLRLVLGEMSDVVLTGARVSAEKIQKAGFTFDYPEAVAALQDILKRKV